MSPKHDHAHCKHAKLEYCGHCNVVWCHDCSAEFQPRVTWYGTTYTYGNTTGIDLGFKSMTNAEAPVSMPGTIHHHGG